MEINKREIEKIIDENVLDNLICKSLEVRPSELAKYICGLANCEGGHILIGVERDSENLKVVGFSTAFDMQKIVESACTMLKGNFQSTYTNVNVCGKNVYAIKVEKSELPVNVGDKSYYFKNNGVEILEAQAPKGPSTLFISYTECDNPIVDMIENVVRDKLGDKIRISRYTKLEYKDSFKAFMDTIEDHDFVLSVVSDTYLRSQACMYEVGETIKSRHYTDKLLFVVLSEKERKYYGEGAPEKIGANIYGGAVARLEYIGYWKAKFESLESAIGVIGDHEATSEATKELRIIGQIYRRDIGEFLQFLSDENGKNFEKLYESDFEDIVNWIVKKS